MLLFFGGVLVTEQVKKEPLKNCMMFSGETFSCINARQGLDFFFSFFSPSTLLLINREIWMSSFKKQDIALFFFIYFLWKIGFTTTYHLSRWLCRWPSWQIKHTFPKNCSNLREKNRAHLIFLFTTFTVDLRTTLGLIWGLGLSSPIPFVGDTVGPRSAM